MKIYSLLLLVAGLLATALPTNAATDLNDFRGTYRGKVFFTTGANTIPGPATIKFTAKNGGKVGRAVVSATVVDGTTYEVGNTYDFKPGRVLNVAQIVPLSISLPFSTKYSLNAKKKLISAATPILLNGAVVNVSTTMKLKTVGKRSTLQITQLVSVNNMQAYSVIYTGTRKLSSK